MAQKQQKRPTLQMPLSEARDRIRKQIEKGQKLLESPIRNEAELKQAQNERKKWSDYNAKLLRGIVDTDELINTYYPGYGFIPTGRRSFLERVEDFYSDVRKYIVRLESIFEYLELIPELSALAQPTDEVEIAPKPTVVPFVSMSFDEADKEINDYVTGILDALQIDFETGERYSRESIPQKVQSRIRSSDLFIVILVKRAKIEDGGYTAPPWLYKELGLAQGAQRDVIAWVERGIEDLAGLDYEKEVIYFERDSVKEMKKATIKFLEALKEHNLV